MEFYGVVMDVQDNQLRFLALVFELCKASLKNHIFKNEENKPWRTNSAAIITCRWGVEILDALEFIHSKKIVHRDLKLENVLVSLSIITCCKFPPVTIQTVDAKD